MDMQEREQEQGRHTGCKTFHHKRPPFLRNEVFLAIVLPVSVPSPLFGSVSRGAHRYIPRPESRCGLQKYWSHLRWSHSSYSFDEKRERERERRLFSCWRLRFCIFLVYDYLLGFYHRTPRFSWHHCMFLSQLLANIPVLI